MSALPFPGNPGEAVPEVDAADVKAVYEAYREAQSHRPPGEPTALCMGLLTDCCSPGADVPAVSYRAMFLRTMIEYMPELAAVVKDGQPHEALFRIMADIPMEWMAVGIERQGFPLDGEKFMRRVNNLSESP